MRAGGRTLADASANVLRCLPSLAPALERASVCRTVRYRSRIVLLLPIAGRHEAHPLPHQQQVHVASLATQQRSACTARSGAAQLRGGHTCMRRPPSYYIVAGLVFTPCTVPYLRSEYGEYASPPHCMLCQGRCQCDNLFLHTTQARSLILMHQ